MATTNVSGTFVRIFRWINSIFFLIIGITSFAAIESKVEATILFFIFILLGLLLFPPLDKYIAGKITPLANTYAKFGVGFALICVAGFFVVMDEKNKAEELKQYHDNIIAYVNEHSNEPIIKNMTVLNDNYNLFTENNYKLFRLRDTTIFKLDEKKGLGLYSPFFYLNLDSKDFMKDDSEKRSVKKYEWLFSFDKDKKITDVNAFVTYTNGEEIQWLREEAIDFSKLLLTDKIAAAKEENKRRKAEQAEAERQEKLARQRKAELKEFLENCLSIGDGSCPAVVDYLKSNLKDPDSYKHIETRAGNEGDYFVVITKYRAKNGFGGYNTGYIQARVSSNCELLGVDSFE